MTASTSRIQAQLESLKASNLSADEREIFLYALLVQRGMDKTLVQILDSSKDRRSCNDKILSAVQMVKGVSYGFSQHGIVRRLDGRFNDDLKAEIAMMLRRLSDLLLERLQMQSFVTSGTLLGLVREGGFLGHDFDFDMAYISNKVTKDEISEERRDVMAAINGSGIFRIEKDFLGKAKVLFEIGSETVVLDLFVGYRNGDFFNEVPLEPNVVRFEDISPVRTMNLYGVDVFVPKFPEKLLEINYGTEWRTPDPSFRFDFGKYAQHYWFLKKTAITP